MPDLLQWTLVGLVGVLLPALGWALVQLELAKARRGGPEDGRLKDLLGSLVRLDELSMESTEISTLQPYCKEVLEDACRLMGAPRASMMLYDDQRNVLRIVAAKGLPEEAVNTVELKPGQGLAGRAFETGSRQFHADPASDPAFHHMPGSESYLEAVLTIPLKIKNKPVGVLNLHPPHDGFTWADADLRFMDVLAAQAAGTLETLKLYENLERFYLEMVETLARAVDAKDSYTHDHSDRARRRARQVALAMGLSDEVVKQTEYAALLHDVGKIGIDDSILLKPAKLTPEEYEKMKQHPAIGYRILEPIKYLAPVAKMVLAHQEWFNGAGYPNGWKGDEIPIGARIVSVIDAWDAMTSDRVYRKALPRERAVAELRKYAGTQFDPGVVEVFLGLAEAEAAPGPESHPR